MQSNLCTQSFRARQTGQGARWAAGASGISASRRQENVTMSSSWLGGHAAVPGDMEGKQLIKLWCCSQDLCRIFWVCRELSGFSWICRDLQDLTHFFLSGFVGICRSDGIFRDLSEIVWKKIKFHRYARDSKRRQQRRQRESDSGELGRHDTVCFAHAASHVTKRVGWL